jgi:hypothetical protein
MKHHPPPIVGRGEDFNEQFAHRYGPEAGEQMRQRTARLDAHDRAEDRADLHRMRAGLVIPSTTRARPQVRRRGAGRPALRGAGRRSSARSGDSGSDDDPAPSSPFEPLSPLPAIRGQLQLWPEPRR